MKVAVLGAGPMGLAAACQLALDGHQPIVFEADDRLGGMSASFDFDGLQIERYYHFHCTSDTAFLEMLDILNISDRMRWTETSMGYWYEGRVQDWGNPLALLRFRGLSPVAKFRYGLHAFQCTRRRDWQSLDHRNAREWIRSHVGAEAWRILWQPLFDYKFYDYSDNLSAAWIWSRIHRVGNSRYNLMREKLGYLEGGSQTLLDAMARTIVEAGGEIHLSTPVQEVVIQDDRLAGVRTQRRSDATDTAPTGDEANIQPFDQVISTIPLPFIPRLIPDLPVAVLDKYRQLNNIAVVCVIAKLARPLTDKFWLNINAVDMDIPGLVEYTNLRPLDDHIVYVPFYLPGEHPKYAEPDVHFADKVRRYLLTINADLKEEDILNIHVSRYRYAQPICEPGFLQRLPPYKTSVDGLWVADTSYYYPWDRGISESIDFGRKLAREAVTC